MAEDATATVPLDAEERVRRLLAEVEAALRGTALAALADWSRLEVPAPALVPALAAIERPGMGAWNGLLGALRAARAAALRDASPERRAAIEAAPHLSGALAGWEEALPPPEALSAKALGALARHALPGRPRARDGFAAAIALRNRAVHDAPTDPAFWSEALRSLEGLAPTLLEAAARGALPEPPPAWAAPWVVPGEPAGPGAAGGPALTYRGLERSGAALHAPPGGATTASPERGRHVLLALARLSGRADLAERDVRTLLSRLAPEETRGVLLGDFLVGPPVGEGGFATVHAARQVTTGRKVAVKLLRDGLPEESRERFRREAEFLSRFSSPHIVAVLAAGEEPWSLPRGASASGEPWLEALVKGAPVKTFIALEWVEGETLEAVFARAVEAGRPPPVTTCVRWLADLAGALGAVHTAGLVHRDVKPANIMIAHDGRALVMDFGIARTQDESRTLLTATGAAVGTPAYMAPEQLRAAPGEPDAGPSVDVYALCACFYELLSLGRLYDHDRASGDVVRVKKIGGERPRPLPRAVPPEVRALVQGGVEPEARDRPASMAALEEDARRILQDRPPLYRRPSLARRAVLAWRRSPVAYALTTTAVLLALLGVAVYVRDVGAERTEAQRARGEERAARLLAESREAETRRALAGALFARAEGAAEDAEWGAAEVLLARALLLEDRLETRERLIAARAWGARRAWSSAGPPLLGAAVAWSADGRRIAASVIGDGQGAPGRIAVFDAETGAPTALLDARSRVGSKFAISDDGARVVSGGEDGRVHLYDLRGGDTRTLRAGSARVEAVGFLADGERIAVVDRAGRCVIVDAGSGSVVAERSIDGELRRVQVLRSGQILIPGSDGARILDLVGGAAPLAISSPTPTSEEEAAVAADLEFSRPAASATPDGKRIAVLDARGFVTVLERGRLTPLLRLPPRARGVDAVALSRDGARIAVAERMGCVRVLAVDDGRSLALPEPIDVDDCGIVFSADGRRIALTGLLGLEVLDVPGRPDAPLARSSWHVNDPQLGAFAAARTAVIMASPTGIAALDLATGDPLLRVDHEPEAVGAASLDAAGRLLAGVYLGGTVKVHDAATGVLVTSTAFDRVHVDVIATSPDGRYVAVGGYEGRVEVIDTATGGIGESNLVHPDASVLAVAWGSPARPKGGALLASSGTDGRVVIRGAAGGAPRAFSALAGSLAFRPDGRVLASLEKDRFVRLRSVQDDGTAPRALGPLPSQVGVLAWSPDGRLIAVGTESGDAVVFVADTGERLLALRVPGLGGASLAFVEEGRALVVYRSSVAHRFDLGTPGLLRTVETERPGVLTSALAASSDGRRLAASHAPARGLTLVDLRASHPEWRAADAGAAVFPGRACFAPDGRRVAVASDHEVLVFDAETGERAGRIVLPARNEESGQREMQGASEMAWPAPSTLAVADGRRVRLLAVNGGVLRADGDASQALDLGVIAASRDGRRLGARGEEGGFRLLDAASLEVLGVTTGLEAIGLRCAFLDGGGARLAALLDDDTLRLWDAAADREGAPPLHLEAEPRDLAASPDGRLVALSGPGPDVRLIRVEAQGYVPLCALRSRLRIATTAAFAGPSGRTLAVGGEDGPLHLWDLDEVERLLAMPAPALYADSIGRTGLAVKDGEVAHALTARLGRAARTHRRE